MGWTIRYYNINEPWLHKLPKSMDVVDVYDHACWALMSLGWDMGAIDVLEDWDGKAWVLEANSCPGLNDENTAKVYLDYIERRMGCRPRTTTEGLTCMPSRGIPHSLSWATS
jgi:hypothetical protein